MGIWTGDTYIYVVYMLYIHVYCRAFSILRGEPGIRGSVREIKGDSGILRENTCRVELEIWGIATMGGSVPLWEPFGLQFHGTFPTETAISFFLPFFLSFFLSGKRGVVV